jgi:hypothetical protein
MRRGVALALGILGGALVGGLGTFVAALVYFVATGSGGPSGLGIAVVLAALFGLWGALLGGLLGALLGLGRT